MDHAPTAGILAHDEAPTRYAEEIVAGLGVLYMLSGRWSFARVTRGMFDHDDWLAQPRTYFVPALVAAVLVAMGGAPRERTGPTPAGAQGTTLFTVGFLGYMMCTVLWIDAPELATKKFAEVGLVLLASLAFGVALWKLDGPHIVRAFLRYLTAATGALALLGLASVGGGRLAVLGGGPNVFGRNMGLLCASCIYYWRTAQAPVPWMRFGWLGGIAATLLLIVLTGSRGALVAVMAMLTLTFLFARQRSRAAMVLGFLFLAVVTYFLIADTAVGLAVENLFQKRIVEQTLQKRRLAGRGELYSTALNLGMANPLVGVGLSGSHTRMGIYPHNLFLEAFAEGGFFGLGLLFGALISMLRGAGRPDRPLPMVAVGMATVLFMSAQFSGDFYDTRGFFLFMPLVVAAFAIDRRASATESARRPDGAESPGWRPGASLETPPA